jgi:BirA family transcriptional regulator, biotin operon repressor / biotin---[acetyl-CoA-carboxylase] ligase
LAHSLKTLLDAPIIELDTIDSTNNYAMRLIDADTAQPGLTIVAGAQLEGKGQRGKTWKDVPGESLLTSIICAPECDIEAQFVFNAAVAVSIAEVLIDMYENWDVRIKWPNDIIINDKKAGGILIENILRGNSWTYSIIGLGLNVCQAILPAELPFAISLKQASGKDLKVKDLLILLRANILRRTSGNLVQEYVMKEYNDFLYRKDREQSFTDGSEEWNAIIKSAGSNGQLQVQLADGSILHYSHGFAQWKWG